MYYLLFKETQNFNFNYQTQSFDVYFTDNTEPHNLTKPPLKIFFNCSELNQN